MFCWHQWQEPKDRYQTCSKCCKTRPVKCAHQWKEIERYNHWRDNEDGRGRYTVGKIYIKECIHCGIIEKFRVSV